MSKFTTEVRWICISIHALRVEGDRRIFFFVTGSRISIHALRVEGDSERGDAEQLPHIFLSTPSGWRATVDYRFEDWNKNISIHALRVEGDRIPCKRVSRHIHFYPRPPGGGRPVACVKRVYNVEISIHALRVEGDASGSAGRSYVSNFYPRPPGGGRLSPFANAIAFIPFLSTPSGWRATTGLPETCDVRTLISIHALRVEGDKEIVVFEDLYREFLSTPSGWRATSEQRQQQTAKRFLSTPSGWRATFVLIVLSGAKRGFLSTPSGWRATFACILKSSEGGISIHALRVEGDGCRI